MRTTGLRSGTRARRQHLKAIADAIETCIFADEPLDGQESIAIEEIWWWLWQAGMKMAKQYTGKQIGKFALIAQSMLYGYVARLSTEEYDEIR